MKNYKMIITYDGTRYYGWEHQPTTDMTIQGKLESVLSAMTGTEVEVIGAGRTDAGVHAKKYGSADSTAAFVNGVLGKLIKE